MLSSDAEFVEKFNNDFQYPYPVAGFAVLMATELLRRMSLVLEYVEKTKVYREELIEGLQRLGTDLRVIPRSDANFVLVKSNLSKKIAGELPEQVCDGREIHSKDGHRKRILENHRGFPRIEREVALFAEKNNCRVRSG